MTLADLLTREVVAVAVVFARLGSALMIVPGFDEIYVPPRLRLLLALTLAVVLAPALAPGLAMLPRSDDPALLLVVTHEVTVGLLIGAVVRLAMVAVSLGGNLVAAQSGLAGAVFFDPHEATQSSIGSSFLATTAITLMFAVDAHHGVLIALAGSYGSLPVGEPLPLGDMGQLLVRTLAAATGAGLRIAAPVIAISLLLNACLGALGRLVPSVQTLFVAAPLQLMVGLAVFALGLAAGLRVFLDLLDGITRTFGA
jgi:flagellar biosynthetic protein FliR